MKLDINYFVLDILGILGLFVKDKSFKRIYHYSFVLFILYCTIKGKLNQSLILLYFYIVIYWNILKNNCFLSIHQNGDIINNINSNFATKLNTFIKFVDFLVIFLIIGKTMSKIDCILLYLIVINSELNIYESLNYTNLRYLSIFLMYFIFLKYFKDIDLDLRISYIIIYIFFMCYLRKLLNEKVKPNTIDKILMFVVPFTTLIEI